MKLYEIAQKYTQVFDLITNLEDLPPEVIEDTLESCSEELEEKSLNIAAIIKNINYDVEAMKDYEKKMNQKRRTLENRVTFLKDYLKEHMNICKVSKFCNQELSISIRKSPISVIIDNIEKVPEKFKDIQISVNINKAEIKKAFKDGDKINGVHLEEDNTTLVIK